MFNYQRVLNIYIYDCGWLDAQCLVGPEYFAQFVYKPTQLYVGNHYKSLLDYL
jgi:hypothetical protein